MTKLQEFEQFLSDVDLSYYRQQYQPIKIVEMDLPKDIHALELLYHIYWDKQEFISYEKFYQIYSQKYNEAIESFRKKTTMCKDCFSRGLPARIYRTWASIITQIHAGYVAESVFGAGTINMSADLDHKGSDFQVKYKNVTLNYQVKKKSFSREVRAPKISKNPIPGKFIDIWYDVPASSYFNDPKKKNGEYREPYIKFMNNKELKRMPNGFVIFTDLPFLRDKKIIDTQL